MSDRTGHEQDQPSPALRENRVLAEPATLQRCAEDYADAAGDRRAVDRHLRNGH